MICFECSGAAVAAWMEDVPYRPVSLSVSLPLWLALNLALGSEREIIWPVRLQELSGFVSLCSIRAGWECAHRERGNVFDIRSAHTVGEAGTAGYD